ncbi:Superoxide dismutase [Mn], mitochondrial [Orchesella cincta]|uniref:superoxide dismutase n=1 Tax=Orchesella cincta TaxID=48709 RepID=A0A1D2MG39_ORCCI|nr:Superoxide dismutase [Mn], mitochondrial [Orchesella cincta]
MLRQCTPLIRRGLASNFPAATSAATASIRSKHTLPDLPYDYNALEPVISAEIMTLHHSKHHQTYVNNLNVAEEKLAEAKAKNDISTVIALAPALKFNGGGHLNHSIFWQNLSPKGGGEPTGALGDAIKRDFGSFENLKTRLSAALLVFKDPVGDGLDTTRCRRGLKLQPVLIKIRWKRPLDLCHCSGLMFGNMPTISNIRMYDPTM